MAQAQSWGVYDRHDDVDRNVDEGQRDRDHRTDEGLRESFHAPVRLVTIDVTRKRTVDFPRSAGRFQTLRIHAIRGVGYIDFVTVRFGNGEQQHVDVKHVVGRDEDIDISTGGRYVEAITVHGAPNPRDRFSRRARVQIIGMR